MSKEVVNVQMERWFYDKVMNGESAGGGEELIFFDTDVLFENADFDTEVAIEETVQMALPFGSKVSILAQYEEYQGIKRCNTVLSFPLPKYFVTNRNKGVAEEIMLGSGGLVFLNMDYTKNISLYEFMEMFFDTIGADGSNIIQRFKSAEVTEEEVMQWLQTPVEE
jgi:hypothetical protein